MKFTVTDRNVTTAEENENCQVISQVKSLLSNVEETLSSVCTKMVCVNVKTRKKILPYVSQILYQVETIVSSSSQPLDATTDLWWDESGVNLEESYGQDDSILSDVFLFSDAMSTSSASISRYSSMSSPSRDSSMSSSSRDSSKSSSRYSSTSSSSRYSSASSSSSYSSRSSPSSGSSTTSSDISSDSNTIGEHNLSEWAYSDSEQDIQELEDKTFFESILQVMSSVAPNNIFNEGKSTQRRKRKLRRKRRAALHPSLYTLWLNTQEIVTPREKKFVDNEMIYPQVDWTQVNQRFLCNLPKPEQLPKHGCFPEAEKHLYDPDRKNTLGKSYFETKPYVFGYGYGFRTDQGVIKRGAGAEIVHGYVWSDTDWMWVLNTKKAGNEKVPKKGFHKVEGVSNFKKKVRRKKEPR